MPDGIVGSKGVKRAVGPAGINMVYHGGPLLANVEVTTIYWGSAWAADPVRTQLDAFFDFIVKSPYIDQLSEYSVPGLQIGPGKHMTSLLMMASEPPSTVDDTAIQAFIQQLLSGGSLPAQTPNSLYFVFTPSGVTVTLQGASSCQDFCGYHNSPDGSLFYAVMPYPDCAGCNFAPDLLDSFTIIASHELGEAITDPALTAWFDDGSGQEIGDPCEGSNKTITTGAVPAFQSAVAAPVFNVTVSPATVALDGSSPATLITITLTPTTVQPPPPPPPGPAASYQVQTLWSNNAGGCV